MITDKQRRQLDEVGLKIAGDREYFSFFRHLLVVGKGNKDKIINSIDAARSKFGISETNIIPKDYNL